MFLVQPCIADSWSPRIGDPTPLGWLTTFAYLVTAGLSWFTLRHARPSDSVEYRVFWALIAVGFAFLGVNKQLDLQTFATAVLKCVAQANGWYGERRHDQAIFIFGLVAGGSFLLLSAIWYFRQIYELIALALIGCALLAVFVMLRAATFNHEDELIGIPLLGTQTADALLELPGILLVAINGALLILKGRGRAMMARAHGVDLSRPRY